MVKLGYEHLTLMVKLAYERRSQARGRGEATLEQSLMVKRSALSSTTRWGNKARRLK